MDGYPANNVSEVTLSNEIAAAVIDPASYGSNGRIQDVHAWMRAHNPFGLAQIDGYDPFSVVTKHRDLRDIGANNDLFRSEEAAIFLTDRAGQAHIREV